MFSKWNEERDAAVRELLEKAGVQRDLVEALKPKLRDLLQPVDHGDRHRNGNYETLAEFHFDLERQRGG